MKRAIAVALAIGACRPAASTMTPSAEVQRQTELGGEYIAAEDRERAAAAELARAEAAEQEAAARVEAHEREDEAEVDRYAAALVEAREVAQDCRVGFERLVQLHGYLRQFVAEPRRDAAIEGLERCRWQVVDARSRELGAAQAERREAFARSLEQEFAQAHPDARRGLSAQVKGRALVVKLRNDPRWSTLDGRREVEAWCARAPYFASIELRGPQGTSRCSPAPEEEIAAQLRADGLAEPWVPVTSGRFATPVVGEAQYDGEGLARLRAELDAARQRTQASRAALAHASQEAEAKAGRLRGGDEDGAVEAEHDGALAKRKYNRMIIAGLPLNVVGVVFSLVGVASLMAWQNIDDGTRRFGSAQEREAALQRAARTAIIGYSVGVPLLAAGLTLSLLGVRGLQRVNRLTFSAGGIGVRF